MGLGNMFSTNFRYENAMRQYNKAMRNYQDNIDKLTGKKAYETSLDMAKKTANDLSGETRRQAALSARSQGLSPGMAAALAANQAAGGYNQNMLNQQGQAANQLSNQLSAYNQNVQNAYNKIAPQQQEGQNAYSRAWGNIKNTTGILGSLLSDARMKDSCNISELSKKIDSILDAGKTKKVNYKDLMITRKV